MKKKETIMPMKNIMNAIMSFFSNLFKGFTPFFQRFWSKTKEIWGIFDKSKAKPIVAKVLISLLVLIVFVEVAFGIMVYGFKVDNNFTKMTGQILPLPVAVVNYEFVSYRDFLDEKTYIHHFYGATSQQGIDYKNIDSQIMDQLIEDRIVAYQAVKYHVSVKNSDVDAAVQQISDQNGGQDKVEKVLNDLYGLSLDSFKRLVRTQLLSEKVNDKVIQKVTVRHILIQVDKSATADQVAAAKAKIDDVVKQINGGMSFSDAAKKYSEDTGSASNGGLLDPFARGQMVQQFSDTAFATPVGKISAPVRSDYGWHIIEVEAKSGSVDQSFTDWIAGIKNKSLILKFYKI